MNILEREKKLRQMPTEELDAILRQEQESAAAPDVDRIKAVLRELDRRGKFPEVDVDAAWNDFRENYLDGLVMYADELDRAKGDKQMPLDMETIGFFLYMEEQESKVNSRSKPCFREMESKVSSRSKPCFMEEEDEDEED